MVTRAGNATRKLPITLAVIVTLALAFSISLFTRVDSADAKMRTGTYTYTYGHPELWGIGQGPQSGYILGCTIREVSGAYATLKIYQTRFYGEGGYYRADQDPAKTVKFKNRRATFTFRTFCGDVCKVKVILVSKTKMKLAVKTTKYGLERMPISTGYKYKLLRWDKSATEYEKMLS